MDAVLVCRSAELFVKLTRTRKRGTWEYVESIDEATHFTSEREIDRRTIEHHCPVSCYKVSELI
jgi:hypothetical protein